jgi:hypothetical protein
MRDLEVKRLDLMLDINLRGTFVLTRAALPHLRESDHAHVLSLSPPISADPKWLRGHSAYTVAKYGMTMVTLGVAADEAEAGIGANTLWPRTLIATAAVQNLLGGEEAMRRAPTPEIYADSALAILRRDPRECTGHSFIDDEVLAEEGSPTCRSTAPWPTPIYSSTCSWTAGPSSRRSTGGGRPGGSPQDLQAGAPAWREPAGSAGGGAAAGSPPQDLQAGPARRQSAAGSTGGAAPAAARRAPRPAPPPGAPPPHAAWSESACR